MLRLLIGASCVFLSFAGASAKNWKTDFQALVHASTESARDTLIARIVGAKPQWRDVATAIRTVTFVPTTGGKWSLYSIAGIDDVTRPYALYVPSNYNPKLATPLLVHLHGVVGRPIIDTNPDQYVGNSAIMAEAERRDWLVLFPFGQEKATWWDEVGMGNVANEIRAVKTTYNVDDNRVYLSGLSDGATGAFLFSMAKPDDFAAYVAINGSMGGGSEDGGLSLYATNMARSHYYVANADRDRYFPADQMERTIALARRAGADISYHRLVGEHVPTMQAIEYPPVFDYLNQCTRAVTPDTLVWESAVPQFGQCKWLGIDEVTVDEPAPWYVDYNVSLVDSSTSIGIQTSDTFPGPGVMVASLSGGDCLSRRIGLKPGDILLGGNGVAIDSMPDLAKYRKTLKRGAEATMMIKRGNEQTTLHCRMPVPRNYFIFNRTQPSAEIKATYADNRFDLQGSRVGAFRLMISPEMVDVSRNVVVLFNGKQIFDGRIEPDISFLLKSYLANRDRSMLFLNQVTFRP
ncbi:MAG: PHB depolymerase family esterase [Candidatus Zixiibacteriota bacterium]